MATPKNMSKEVYIEQLEAEIAKLEDSLYTERQGRTLDNKEITALKDTISRRNAFVTDLRGQIKAEKLSWRKVNISKKDIESYLHGEIGGVTIGGRNVEVTFTE